MTHFAKMPVFFFKI